MLFINAIVMTRFDMFEEHSSLNTKIVTDECTAFRLP